LASKNPNKAAEVGRLAEGSGIVFTACPASVSFPEETGSTFEENARIKADHLRSLGEELVAGEDSGLAVDVLGGLPGVRSARFAGEGSTDAANVAALLAALAPFTDPVRRRARFVTVVCLATPRETAFFRGEIEGVIVFEPRGSGGFGYDPVFEVPGTGRTFAEMAMEEKNAMSHRAAAFRALIARLSARGPA